MPTETTTLPVRVWGSGTANTENEGTEVLEEKQQQYIKESSTVLSVRDSKDAETALMFCRAILGV